MDPLSNQIDVMLCMIKFMFTYGFSSYILWSNTIDAEVILCINLQTQRAYNKMCFIHRTQYQPRESVHEIKKIGYKGGPAVG